LTQVVSAAAEPSSNAGVILRGADVNADGTQLTVKYSAQTADKTLHFCATITGGSLTSDEQGTLKDDSGKEIGSYYVNVDSSTNTSKVNFNVEANTKTDAASLTLPLSNAPGSVTVTDDDNASNTVTATNPQAPAAAVNLNDYAPAGQEIAKVSAFSFKDAQGNDIKPDKDGTYELPPDAQARYEYQFAVPNQLKDNHQVQAGDYFTFDLPEGVKADDGQGELDGNPSLGSYTVRNNQVTITLNQNAVGNTDIKGTFVHTESAKNITTTGLQQFTTPVTDSKNVIAVNREDKTQEDVSKTGTAINARNGSGENPNQISWDVVFNTARKLLTNASITDPLPDGLSLNAKTPVTVEDTTTGKPLILGSDYTFDRDDNNRVKLTGDYAKTGDAFMVTYLTDISEDKIPDKGGRVDFRNVATLHDQDENIPAKSTVTTKYGKLLDKSGRTEIEDGQIFSWVVKFNYGEKTVKAGTKVTDRLLVTPQKYLHDPLHTSMSLHYVNFDADCNEIDGGVVPENLYTINYDDQKGTFTITWNQDIKRAVRIDYKTQATVPLADQNGGDGSTVADPDNPIVGLNVGNEAGTGDTTVPFTITGNQLELQKSLTGTNYNTKTNDWKITVNAGEQLVNFFEVSDTLPDALSLKGTPEVFDESTKKQLTLGKDYLVTGTNQKNDGFRLIFTGDYQKTSDKFTITYHTNFNTEKITQDGRVDNHADSFWVDGTGDKHHNHQVVPFGPGDKFLHDASKGGEYNATAKHITWTVGVNYNQRQLNGARVYDPIPEGQTYVPGSVQVYRGSIKDETVSNGDDAIQGPGELVPAMDYNVQFSGNNLMTALPHDNGVYYIKFDTTLDNQLIGTTDYANTALFTNGDERHPVTGHATVNNGGKYIDKTGAQDSDTKLVDWSVDVNPSQSTLDKVKVVDKPSANQFVDVDSIKVFQIQQDKDGKQAGETPAVAGKDYTVDLDTDYTTGNQTLTINFTGTITNEYRVDYQAKVNTSVDQSVLSNDVTINGDHIKTVSGTKTSTVTIQQNGGTSDCVEGPNLTFQLTKVDGDNTATTLSGVRFMLFMAKRSTDGSGSDGFVKDGEMVREGTTAADGTLSWTNLRPGQYILQEDLNTTPKGYIAGAYAQGKHITLQKNGSTTDANGNTVDLDQQQVANYGSGEVTLTKTARETGKTLAGATYELYRVDAKGQNPVDTGKNATTDAQGKLRIVNLAPAKYYLQETKAPAGYLLNDKHYVFAISRNQRMGVFPNLHATDEHWRGSVEVTKLDFNHPDKKLARAEFELCDEAGKVQADVMTDGNGVARVSGLLPGKYYFKEVHAPAGYKLDKDTHYTVIVDEHTQEQQKGTQLPPAAQTRVYDEELTGGAKLLKLDGLTQTPLAGAEFTLYSSLNPGVALQNGLTTNAQGELSVTNLIPGEYYLVEAKAPAGYILPAIKQQYHFTVAFNQQQDQVPVVTAQNTPYLGRLQLTKESKQTGAVVADAVYGLFDAKGVQKRTLTTDAKGNAQAEYLEPGAYTLRELQAPAGYKLDTKSYPITISKQTNGDTVRQTVFDEVQCGRVQLHKTDAQSGRALKGAEFTLYRDAEEGAVDPSKFTPIKVTTDANGDAAVKDLQPGKYYFVETKAPAGYSYDGTRQYAVTVAPDQDAAQVPVANVQDEPFQGNVKITKHDAQNKQAVVGASYALYSANGKLVKDKLITAKDGSVTVKDLLPGDYYFKETKAPAGYELNPAKVAVTVAFNQPDATAAVTTTDQEMTGGVVLSKTDAQSGQKLAGAHFDLYKADGTVVKRDLSTATDG
jgi:uncharacterized surface anchored protein